MNFAARMEESGFFFPKIVVESIIKIHRQYILYNPTKITFHFKGSMINEKI